MCQILTICELSMSQWWNYVFDYNFEKNLAYHSVSFFLHFWEFIPGPHIHRIGQSSTTELYHNLT